MPLLHTNNLLDASGRAINRRPKFPALSVSPYTLSLCVSDSIFTLTLVLLRNINCFLCLHPLTFALYLSLPLSLSPSLPLSLSLSLSLSLFSVAEKTKKTLKVSGFFWEETTFAWIPTVLGDSPWASV